MVLAASGPPSSARNPCRITYCGKARPRGVRTDPSKVNKREPLREDGLGQLPTPPRGNTQNFYFNMSLVVYVMVIVEEPDIKQLPEHIF